MTIFKWRIVHWILLIVGLVLCIAAIISGNEVLEMVSAVAGAAVFYSALIVRVVFRCYPYCRRVLPAQGNIIAYCPYCGETLEE